jgi:hypothetical protein
MDTGNNLRQTDRVSMSNELTMHRFKSPRDLEQLFQAEIDKFPVVYSVRQFSEFGAIMIRPKDEPKNKLIHIVFPPTALSIPKAGLSFKGHSSIMFPQVSLMADCSNDTLYIKLIADSKTEDGLTERKSLIIPSGQFFFNCDIWNTIPDEDKIALSQSGFGSGMNDEQWGKAINQYQHSNYPASYASNNSFIKARELPVSINRYGCVGTLDSYYLMPEFILAAINNNRFVFEGMDASGTEEEIPYEIGSAHIHPQREFEGFEAELAKRVGEKTVTMTPSPADIHMMRASQNLYGELNLSFRKCDINTSETFLGIIGVSKQGKVTGSLYLDYGNFSDSKEQRRMGDLNNRTITTLKSSNPDIGLVAEHYNYIKSFTKDDFGTKTSSPHVGDSDI